MNEHSDCVYWEIFACDGGPQCGEKCSHYIGFSDRRFSIIREAYDEDVELALAPVNAKWRKLFEDGELL